MLLPVLEKKGVANFSGDEANWKIRHIWGQLGGLCEEEPGLTAVPSTAARSQTLGHDVTIGALPASGTTGCAGTGWHRQLLTAAGFVLQARGRRHHPCLDWKRLCPAAPSTLAHVGLAACSPDVCLWLAALVCCSSLRTGIKRKEDIQCTDGAKNRCDEASHHTRASLNGKRDGGDRACWGREWGAEETPSSRDIGGNRAGLRVVWSC